MKTHKDLDVWKNSIDLVGEVYRLTKAFPKEELFCLTNQLRRAAISVPSNISEGAARNQKREFIRFLRIATGSLTEIETQFQIAHLLHYIPDYEFNDISGKIFQIRSQLSGLIKFLENNTAK